MKGSAGKIQLASLEDFFGTPPSGGEAFQEIPLASLHPFKGHPFHVTDDEKMQEMTESVAQHGILVPGIVRPRPGGGYELVSGHRRKRACELAGLDMIDAQIDSGDLVVIEKTSTANVGDIVVALTDDRLSTLKRLCFDGQKGRYYLHPENVNYKDIYVSSLVVQGVARHIIKAL